MTATVELRDAVHAGTARVVERPERVTGYATGFGYGGTRSPRPTRA
jgi:hypothetical protein